jgi:hypothetical protein
MTPSPSTTSPIIYLDLALGNESTYNTSLEEYQTVVDWYEKNRQVYGFDEDKRVDELDEVGGELLKGCFEAENVRLSFLDSAFFILPSFPFPFALFLHGSYIRLWVMHTYQHSSYHTLSSRAGLVLSRRCHLISIL